MNDETTPSLSRLELVMIVVGLIWFAAYSLEPFAKSGTAPEVALEIVFTIGWVLFILDFVYRFAVSKEKWMFLRGHWWEAAILTLPALRMLRTVRVIRIARAGRALASATRLTRSAERTLAGRVATLVVVTIILVFIGGRLLWDFGGTASYPTALRHAGLAALGGHTFGATTPVATVVEFTLIIYSLVIFGAFAGILGAYFLREDEAVERLNALRRKKSSPPLTPTDEM